MTRVAFVDRDPPSGFMAQDREALESRFDLERLEYSRLDGRHLRESVAAARSCEAVEVFFASEHALLPALAFRLFGRRVILVHGGYDYARAPGHDYGLQQPFKRWLPRLIGSLATSALAISHQAQWEFLEAVPSAAPRSTVLPLSVNTARWPDPGVERTGRVVTFGYVTSESYSRKGVDRFLALAARDPDREYVLAGSIAAEMRPTVEGAAPSNVTLAGYLSHDELNELLWSASVYVQLSWHEGFGMAMAEAMACGCVPLISTSDALAEVAGRWGVVSSGPSDDPAALHRAVAKAESLDRSEIRDDICNRFAPQRRAVRLAAAMTGAAS